MASTTPTSPETSSEATATRTTTTSPSASQSEPRSQIGAAILTVPNPATIRKRSLLWRYFTKLNEREARCDNCAMKISTEFFIVFYVSIKRGVSVRVA